MQRRPNRLAEAPVIYTAKHLAAICGVTPTRIRQRAAEKGILPLPISEKPLLWSATDAKRIVDSYPPRRRRKVA